MGAQCGDVQPGGVVQEHQPAVPASQLAVHHRQRLMDGGLVREEKGDTPAPPRPDSVPRLPVASSQVAPTDDHRQEKSPWGVVLHGGHPREGTGGEEDAGEDAAWQGLWRRVREKRLSKN